MRNKESEKQTHTKKGRETEKYRNGETSSEQIKRARKVGEGQARERKKDITFEIERRHNTQKVFKKLHEEKKCQLFLPSPPDRVRGPNPQRRLTAPREKFLVSS